jgi:hypothetical protein
MRTACRKILLNNIYVIDTGKSEPDEGVMNGCRIFHNLAMTRILSCNPPILCYDISIRNGFDYIIF